MTANERQNEAALVCTAQQGDKEAMRVLLVRNWSWLKGLVYSIVGDVDDTEDVMQDICVRVVSKIETLRQAERFRPWLAVIAQRQALKCRQKRSRRPVFLDLERAMRCCDERADSVEGQIEQTEQYEQILEALKSLPEKYSQVFMMAYSSNLTYRQMAEILDVPVTTIQIRLVRARRMIYDRVTERDRNKVAKR